MSKIIICLCLFLLVTCKSHINGPNYNQGKTHNQSKMNRTKIVHKEDIRMKKAMNKSRKIARPKNRFKRVKHNKKFVK